MTFESESRTFTFETQVSFARRGIKNSFEKDGKFISIC